jgi:hypothetical protein
MNASLATYVSSAKLLATERGLSWRVPFDSFGKIPKKSRWDLTLLAGISPPPVIYVSSFAVGTPDLLSLNKHRLRLGQSPLEARPMCTPWRDLYLAVIIHQIVVSKNRPAHALVPARWIRYVAAIAETFPPSALTPDHVRQAYNAVLESGESGKNALNLEMTVRTILDDQALTDTPALARFCNPLEFGPSRTSHERAERERARTGAYSRTDEVRARLSDRKSEDKLPGHRALWELIRIIFQERPRTFSDAVRFALLKILIVQGQRVNETAMLPFDWLRSREYFDGDGASAGVKGGISRSLMIRIFAEKEDEIQDHQGALLYETAQHVSPLFEEHVLEWLSDIAAITSPLRNRLRLQVETGRLFPEYSAEALVPAHEMYVRVSGNLLFSESSVPDSILARYRETYDPTILEDIFASQLASEAPLKPTSTYWTRIAKSGLKIRTRAGGEFAGEIRWRNAFLRVGDVEKFVRVNMPTKLPDWRPTRLADRSPFYPHDFLFLLPVRNLIEGRNDGILDVNRFFTAGRISTNDIFVMLDGNRPDSIFQRYGASEETRQLSVNSHSFRHLQNTELFRLGVADTIITKRFNRRSVRQSYVYDHRSLAEDLANIDLPQEAEEALDEKALEVYRMIVADKVSGPVVEEFRLIQRKHGDDAAFDYLNAEADGLHVTPYGFCVSSFTIDPCPRHLECFNGCRHLTRTNVVEESDNLKRLYDRMKRVIESILAVPVDERATGWRNQLRHAEVRLANILTALSTRPGERPFPTGPDLSEVAEEQLGDSVLDTVQPSRYGDD